jgi:hypothetical protein
VDAYNADNAGPSTTTFDSEEGAFSLGEPAKDAYSSLQLYREQVLQLGRNMAELTVPSVLPHKEWRPGDDVPGNNQSIGAKSVNNLASILTYLAFPPNLPMMRLEPIESELQPQIDANPELWAKTQMALSRLEIAHRKKATTINLSTSWYGFIKLLLVAGNALWKHVKLRNPTYHTPQWYVVQRDANGHQLLVIHEERIFVETLPKDWAAQIRAEKDFKEVKSWVQETCVYSVCRLITDDKGEPDGWEYWQETETGKVLKGSEVETDYDDCPMFAGWLVPAFGHNWGSGYCEEYRGDLYIVESNASAINDGAAMAGFTLGFVKPGSRTSRRQIQEAKNLSFIDGAAEDLTFSRTEKSADMAFVQSNMNNAERRLGSAFLDKLAVRRDGERVTAEEVQETARALDQATGGLYTQVAQGNQKPMVTRFMHLHEEAVKSLPKLPKNLISVEVVTGVDAMGRDADTTNLQRLGDAAKNYFPQEPNALNSETFLTRFAAGLGVKTDDGLITSAADLAAQKQQAQQTQMGMEMAKGASGPMAGALAKGMADRGNADLQQPQAAAAEAGA